MALARTLAVALVGVEGHLVDVEADLALGLPTFALVGLPDASLFESRDRVRAAVVNSGHAWPTRRITVNLSPATLPKRGSGFDLAIACAVLIGAAVLPREPLTGTVLIGELGLDGRLRAVRGVLPAVAAAATAGLRRVLVPAANAAEARLVPGVEVLAVSSLRGLVARLRGDAPELEPEPAPRPADPENPGHPPPDLREVLGQATARHVVEVAAAGGHHLLLLGPPGVGKTMLAERLPGLLPDLDRADALEVSAVHSVAGTLPAGVALLTRPPYAAPHHTASTPAIVGGGSGLPRPGAASLAHRGVLFLDEAPEFAPSVLDALRQPIESGEITVSRASATVRYPARFQLVLAANPCPCGLAVGKGSDCRCTPQAKIRYFGRLSGPLLDRVDLRVVMTAPTRVELAADAAQAEGSEVVAGRVASARSRALARLAETPWRCNAEVPGPVLRRTWTLPPGALRVAESKLYDGELTPRGLDRVLRVAWTLSDLGGRDRPNAVDVALALHYRGLEGRAA